MKTQETKTAKKATTSKKAASAKASAKKAVKETKPAVSKAAKPKPEAKAKANGQATRAGSKTAIILDLLRRKDGASIAEIAEATDWQNHSIRGFLSGQVANKMGLKLESEKVDGERRYRLPA